MSRVMSERLAELLKHPEAAKQLFSIVQNIRVGELSTKKVSFVNTAGEQREYTPRVINVN